MAKNIDLKVCQAVDQLLNQKMQHKIMTAGF